MALGRRKPVQQPLFVTVADLKVRANPFYNAVNRVLDAHHFDTFAEGLCACAPGSTTTASKAAGPGWPLRAMQRLSADFAAIVATAARQLVVIFRRSPAALVA